MKFHGIDMVGEMLLESVNTTTDTNYEARRVVYDSGNLYWGNGSAWVESVGFASGTAMWFYENSAPTGWTLVGSTSDVLLAVKGGSTYTTGGTTAGNWATPSHSHNMNNHTHTVSGTTSPETQSSRDQGGGSSDVAQENHTHPYSTTSGTPSPATTTSGGSSSSYRPESAVGIICTKD